MGSCCCGSQTQDPNSSSVPLKQCSLGSPSVTLSASLAKLNFYFRDNRPCELFAKPQDQMLIALKDTYLYRNQTRTMTDEKEVLKYINQFKTIQELIDYTRNNLKSFSQTEAMPPYSNVNLIVPGVYLTGFYAMTDETIDKENITLILNVTSELPLYKSKSSAILSFRIPMADSDMEPIELYFDDAADLIEYNRRILLANSVVHCTAGVSRSASVMLAYLIKYTSLTLQEAFVHCKSIRTCIRPNMGFFRKLIDFESKLYGESSTKMVEHKDEQTNRSATVPDFYPSQCPDLLLIELDRQNVRKKQ